MKKLPDNQLAELVNTAESELRVSGNLAQATNKIINIAFNRGYQIGREEVRSALIAKLASEAAKDLQMRFQSAPSTIQ